MNQSTQDALDALALLLEQRNLDPDAAVKAAFNLGFKEADATHNQRHGSQQALLQNLSGIQGVKSL